MTGSLMSVSCPPQDELARFQRGEVFGSRLDELSDHLTACGVWQTPLSSITVASDGLLSQLREIRDVAGPDERELTAEIAAVSSLSFDKIEISNSAHSSTACDRRLPQQLAEYAIVGSIGSGGMGAVYRAVHT